jgi:hypothetical protein
MGKWNMAPHIFNIRTSHRHSPAAMTMVLIGQNLGWTIKLARKLQKAKKKKKSFATDFNQIMFLPSCVPQRSCYTEFAVYVKNVEKSECVFSSL